MPRLEIIRDYIANSYGDEDQRRKAIEALDELNTDWQLVPRVPSDEMEQAAFQEAGSPSDWYGFSEQWRAALLAAPKP